MSSSGCGGRGRTAQAGRSAVWLTPLAAASVAATARAEPVVWETGAGGNGNSYEIILDNALGWDDARAAAQAAGGDLVTLTSAEEQGFVQNLLLSTGAPTGSYWMGLRETATEGEFENVTGEPVAFNNFGPGEPNDGGDGPGVGVNETSGAILWTVDEPGADPFLVARRGTWNDAVATGYPAPDLPVPPLADLLRAGYVIEISADGGGGPGPGPNPIPLPTAVYAFPLGALVAGLWARRLRRR